MLVSLQGQAYGGADGLPYAIMEIKSLVVFDTPESCHKYAPGLFKSLTTLTGIEQKNIHILMQPIEPYRIGVDGATKG